MELANSDEEFAKTRELVERRLLQITRDEFIAQTAVDLFCEGITFQDAMMSVRLLGRLIDLGFIAQVK